MKQKKLIGLLIIAVVLPVLTMIAKTNQDTRNKAAGTYYYCVKREKTALNQFDVMPYTGTEDCLTYIQRTLTAKYNAGEVYGCFDNPYACSLKQMYYCQNRKCNETDEKHFTVETCQKAAIYYGHNITCTDKADCGGECDCGNAVGEECCHSYLNEFDTGCNNGLGCKLENNRCYNIYYLCDKTQVVPTEMNCLARFNTQDMSTDSHCSQGNNSCNKSKTTCDLNCKTPKATITPTPTSDPNRYTKFYDCVYKGEACSLLDFGISMTIDECKAKYNIACIPPDKQADCDKMCLTDKVHGYSRSTGCNEMGMFNCVIDDVDPEYYGSQTDAQNKSWCMGDANTCKNPTNTPPIIITNTPTNTPTPGSGSGIPFTRVPDNGNYVCEDGHFKCLADPQGTFKGGTTDENRSACQGPAGGCNVEKRYQRLLNPNNNPICTNGKYQCVENLTSEMNLMACEASCVDPKHYSRVINGGNFVCENTRYKCYENVSGDFFWEDSDAKNLANCQGEYNSCTWTTITPTITLTPTPTSTPTPGFNCGLCSFQKSGYYGPEKTGGDYNCDGIVNMGDYVVWRREYIDKIIGNILKSDGDCDGRVTTADYSKWREKYLL